MSETRESDYQWAQACLRGDPEAVRRFKESFTQKLVPYLRSKGAEPADAEDIAAGLVQDCLFGREDKPPKLREYQPVGRLEAWMNTCAYNKFRDFIRRHSRQTELDTRSRPDEDGQGSGVRLDALDSTPADTGEEDDAVNLLRESLLYGLSALDAEAMVLLRLVFLHGVSQRALAALWACHEATISRKIAAGMQTIRERTLAYMRERDARFEFTWEDCLALCRSHGNLLS